MQYSIYNKIGISYFRPLRKNIYPMETRNNRLQTAWIYAEKRDKTVFLMSGFVPPFKRHKSVIVRFLHSRKLCGVDKTGQAICHLSKIALFVSKIVYVSIDYMLNRHTTFAVDKRNDKK
jgi:hypothetical protein